MGPEMSGSVPIFGVDGGWDLSSSANAQVRTVCANRA